MKVKLITTATLQCPLQDFGFQESCWNH